MSKCTQIGRVLAVSVMAAITTSGAAADDKPTATSEGPSAAKSVYDFTVKDIDGKDVSLAQYKGKVLMIVNVASECGLTDTSYAGLREIYTKYKDQGFEVLAFPANNFGGQEPGDNPTIKAFCASKGGEFPLFSKVSVKGDDMCPLYQYLTNHPDKKVAGDVQWNFQKYVIGRDGRVIAKYSPKLTPNAKGVIEQIEKALAEKTE